MFLPNFFCFVSSVVVVSVVVVVVAVVAYLTHESENEKLIGKLALTLHVQWASKSCNGEAWKQTFRYTGQVDGGRWFQTDR